MSKPSVIVLGGTGLIGSAVCARLRQDGHPVVSVNRQNYAEQAGASAAVLVNCNGNSYRFKANQDPRWDFDASVLSVEKSLFDFAVDRYLFISTIDVYPEASDPRLNHEEAPIEAGRLPPYGFHKWLAERLVERFGRQPLVLRVGTVIGPGVKKGPLFDLAQGALLHMALESELSLIDTSTIAAAVARFVAEPPRHGIINLTGTGSARLGELCQRSGLTPHLAPGAEKTVYDYHVNNERLRSLMPVASSLEFATRFLADAGVQKS